VPRPTKEITYTVDEHGCHICTSHASSTWGYFNVQINGKRRYLHRVLYAEKFGEIKEGTIIRHTCDNPRCINLDHLVEGTHTDNMRDRMDRGRTARGERNRGAILTEQQVLDIFNNCTNSPKELGLKYNVTPTTIRDIKIGKTWKHLTNNLNV
jgi:HNH endonuclease